MIVMALDHVRDFFGVPGVSPTNLALTTAPLFFSQRVTHLGAPTFFPLTSTGAYLALAGWINEQQRDVIDSLQKENRVLREQLGPRRLRSATREDLSSAENKRRIAARDEGGDDGPATPRATPATGAVPLSTVSRLLKR